MTGTTTIPSPHPSSPLDAIQGETAYGDGNPATTTVISYYLAQTATTQAWSAQYIAEFEAALAKFEEVANIQFVRVFDINSADIVEYLDDSGGFSRSDTLGFHYSPFNGASPGQYNTDYWTAGPGGNGSPGGYFFTTILHEIAHGLGLGHPHDTGFGTGILNGVTSPFNSFGSNNLNQGIYTVMSYNDGWTQINGVLPVTATYGGSTGFGALDIAALQAMYGANTTHASGGNVYTLDSTNTTGTGYQAIWDTGGNDTIQHTGNAAATIDLRPATIDYSATGGGAVSHVAGIKGGYTIAQGVVIENASGGSGNDTIIGNTAQNTLSGNNGNDIIHSLSNGSNNNLINGGSGNDTIYAANGTGADTIYGGNNNDVAIINNNAGSFSGGSGTDTVRFVQAASNYLFYNNGSTYEFYNVVTKASFTVSNDVEVFQFSNGAQSYDLAGLTTATAVTDIETTGTTLQSAAQGFYVLDGAGARAQLSLNGAPIGANSIPSWEAIQTEASVGGYKVLWKNTDGTYDEWTVNSAGQFISSTTIANVADVESFYNADINNDSTIGHTVTNVETDGPTSLQTSTQSLYLIDGSIPLTFNGANIGPNSFPGWEAIQTEASVGGYKVLWKNTDGTYDEWTVNSAGQFISSTTIANVADVEAFYGADIDGSGFIGTAPPKIAHPSVVSQISNQTTDPTIANILGINIDVLELISNQQNNTNISNSLDLSVELAKILNIPKAFNSSSSHGTEEHDHGIEGLNNINIIAEDDFLFT